MRIQSLALLPLVAFDRYRALVDVARQGRDVSHRHAAYARQGHDILLQPRVQLLNAALAVSIERRINRKGHEVLGAESRVDALEVIEAVRKQACSHQ